MPTDPTGREHLTPVKITDTSATERAAFRRCRRQWFLGVVHRLQSIDGNQNFWFGTLVHAALEAYYQHLLDNGMGSHDAAANAALDRYEAEYHSSVEPIKEFLAFLWPNVEESYLELGELGLEMLQAYFDREAKEPLFDEIVEVERRVFVPIKSPGGRKVGKLSVRTDAVGRRNGWLAVADHKTASREMSASQLDLDDQLTAEVYAIWKTRKDGEFPEEAIYNVLMKKVPRPPKQLKPGKKSRQWPDGEPKLSKDKSQLTTYDLYLAEIHRLGLDPAEYEEILQYFYNQDHSGESPFFRRDYVMRSPAQMASFEANLYEEFRDMKAVASHPERAYPNPSPFSCPSCSVRLACTMISDDGDVEAIIKATYVVGDPRR